MALWYGYSVWIFLISVRYLDFRISDCSAVVDSVLGIVGDAAMWNDGLRFNLGAEDGTHARFSRRHSRAYMRLVPFAPTCSCGGKTQQNVRSKRRDSRQRREPRRQSKSTSTHDPESTWTLFPAGLLGIFLYGFRARPCRWTKKWNHNRSMWQFWEYP